MPDTGITGVDVSAYEIPTAVPESDGTAEWKATGLVVVELSAADKKGLGYTYGDPSAARLVKDVLAEAIRGIHPFESSPCAHRTRCRGSRADAAASAASRSRPGSPPPQQAQSSWRAA